LTPKTKRPSEEPEQQSSSGGLIALLCVLTVLALTVADFIGDEKIDTFLIGAVVVMAFGFAGKLGEGFFKALAERFLR
jgi:hypothetical protein